MQMPWTQSILLLAVRTRHFMLVPLGWPETSIASLSSTWMEPHVKRSFIAAVAHVVPPSRETSNIKSVPGVTLSTYCVCATILAEVGATAAVSAVDRTARLLVVQRHGIFRTHSLVSRTRCSATAAHRRSGARG